MTEVLNIIGCSSVVSRLKDDVVLSASKRIKISDGADGKYSFTITKVEDSDRGKYTARAFNDSGESRFTATILVRGQ